MNKEKRATLRRAVERARRLLEDEVADQLEGTFGILQGGKVLDDASGDPTVRQRLLELITHHQAGDETAKEAVERATRELAFITLNRFVALKMAERRGLVRECISKGPLSDGIRELADCAPGLRAALPDGGYRLILEAVMDEISIGLSALFDRCAPAGLIWPRPKALDDFLDILNAAELASLWEHDETIGWVYQYFNPKEEREAMRKASAAPRNGRELAVRNQFFTPRYVVAFLVDNTLGRIWFEMRKGDTVLRESCRYLVQRPSDVFLAPGESAPPSKDDKADLPQEELLRLPVYIEHRPQKDPRDIKVLDPACGSGHFLLYAFELLEHIYDEAWVDPDSPASDATGRTLREDYSSIDELRRAAPQLIIEHNLHGIDIDARSVQITALALWLKAQKAWQSNGLKPTERPQIARSNIVTAEPMPGEEEMRREFTTGLKPRVLGQLVDVVFERMSLAGEAGSLLKIEEEIKEGIAAARKQWLGSSVEDQQLLFPSIGTSRPEQREMRFDLADINDERFWEEAENRILDALMAYAERVENGHTIRRLFANDTARGFAFIDLCRKRYDVVLMNPPFGDYTKAITQYTASRYPSGKSDILCSFVERGTDFLNRIGRLGAITNRTPLFASKSQEWRRTYLLGRDRARVVLLADLGHGVLDTALVEACLYCVEPRSGTLEVPCFSVVQVQEKEKVLLDQVSDGPPFLVSHTILESLPQSRLSYWLPKQAARCYARMPSLVDSIASVDKGMSTTDDERFVRMTIELPLAEPGADGWIAYAKGGEYSPFAADIHLSVNWRNGGREIREIIIAKYPYLNGNPDWVLHPETHHGSPGLTYTKRTTSSFSARMLPRGCRVSDLANLVYDESSASLLGTLVVLSTSPFQYLLEATLPAIDSSAGGTAARHYEVGTLREVPVPPAILDSAADAGERLWHIAASRYRTDETTTLFVPPPYYSFESLRQMCETTLQQDEDRWIEALDTHHEIEKEAFVQYGFSADTIAQAVKYLGPHPLDLPAEEMQSLMTPEECLSTKEDALADELVRQYGGKRRFSKQSWIADWRLELSAYIANCSPKEIIECRRSAGLLVPGMLEESARSLLSVAVGIANGRWNRRIITEDSDVEHDDPFSCPVRNSKALLMFCEQNPNSMKILVDDPGGESAQSFRDDIVHRAREVLDLLWKDNAHSIEQEVCEILGVKKLRDYFRRPTGFFDDHLKRYSKSRRKAPIYWPLSTVSGAYTIWVYYHGLTEDTLYRIVSDYVNPKISQLEDRIAQRGGEFKSAQGRDAPRLAKELSELTSLHQELKELRNELLRVARLPYRPNLNDGVRITAAPLWRLFRLPRWRSELERTWQALERGDYDWAHLAYAIWPERVREECGRARSIAIAHGLEELYEERSVPPKPAHRRRGQAG